MSAGERPCRVLICDDQVEIRQALTEVLTSLHGYEKAGEAEDGLTCLEALRETSPDLLILDFALPNGGPELVRAACLIVPDLLIVVYTAHSDEQIRESMLEAGVHEFVVKTGRLLPLQKALSRLSGIE